MKQQRLPSEGHLVIRTDKHQALSAGPGRAAPNSRPGAYIERCGEGRRLYPTITILSGVGRRE